MKFNKLFLIIFLSTTLFSAFSQLGGNYTYTFLNAPFSSRSAALGGGILPMMDKDVTLAINNPSLINEAMHNHFNMSYINYLADINFGSIAYARKLNESYTGFAGIQYVSYGDFIRADEYGNQLGSFTAGDYAFNVAVSKKIKDNLYGGVGLKFIYSSYDDYNSIGIASDLAITYHDADKLFTSTFAVSNLGSQIKPYSSGNYEPLPLNVQFGLSKKLEHMPLRFIMVVHHLNDLDFTYIDPNKKQVSAFDNFGQTNQNTEPPFSEKVFTHFIFAGEFVFSENFHVRIGYNHQRRKELQIENRPGLVGYSFGFGLRINKFLISYGNSIYHVAGTIHSFSITTNLSDFTNTRIGIRKI